MLKFVAFVALLLVGVCTAQLTPEAGGEREENNRRIPCPFLAGLYKRGILTPDEQGRVSSDQVKDAMVKAGSTTPNAIFPAFGTVRFEKDDVHQTKRYWDYSLVPAGLLQDFFPGAPSTISATRLYLNLLTMNAADKCANGTDRAVIPSRFPCNANPQHVQHGYSTTIRDPRFDKEDPTREKRFEDWIGRVLVKDEGLSSTERVMTFDGFAKLLARMAVEGDKSSEWSLNGNELKYDGSNIQHYHPNVKPKDGEALYNWTAYLAWVGLWEAFGKKLPQGTGKYMTESDLRTFFLEGDLPKDWTPSEFTLKDVGYTIIALKGHGIPTGDLWSAAMETYFPLSGWLPSWGEEWRYMVNYANTNRQLGFFLDNILNSYP